MTDNIKFTLGQCSLGAISVATSDHGVVAIAIDDDEDELARRVIKQYPNAQYIRDETLLAQVIQLVEMPTLSCDFALDIRGTAFQQRVWQAVREIPAGQIVSYADIAVKIGAPAAIRSVGAACASNRIAVAIPCHRVVRRDNSLAGYRWGAARKRLLLDREKELI
jgi:AraC family transcriptional regulator of adaptative response/methylated-DNA-[protein]-cysteine methyltransferase